MFRIVVLLAAVCISVVRTQNPEILMDSDVEITIDITPAAAHPGDNMTAVCRVINMHEDDNIYWYKAVVSHGPDGQPVEYVDMIANSALGALPPFDKLGNYKFESHVSGLTRIFTFTVTGVTVEEGGNIGCSYRDIEDNVVAVQRFEVYDPVDYIKVYQNGSEVDELTTEVDTYMFLDILIGESVPAPKVIVTLGAIDVTDDMVETHHAKVVCGGDKVNNPCPVHYLVSTEAQGSAELMEESAEHELVISAYVPGSEFPLYNRTIPVAMNYTPIFKCGKIQSSYMGEEGFSLECLVRGRPTPSVYWWTFLEDNMQRTIIPPYSDDLYEASFEDQDDGGYLATLTISQLDETHFKHYILHAGNAMGNNTFDIDLDEVMPPIGDGAAVPVVSFVLLLLALLI